MWSHQPTSSRFRSEAELKRPAIPPFVSDLYADRTALNGLIAGSVALFASALDPKVWGPSLPSVQAAIAESPQLEALSLLAMLGGSALVLVGGALGDLARAKPIIAGGLAVELIASVVSMLVPTGGILIASRFIGHAAAAFIIPASLALVATSYNGITRATAIGLAYAGFGAAGALAPVLLKLDLGGWTPAFVGSIVACTIALLIVRGRIPELVRPSLPEKRLRRSHGDLGVRNHHRDRRRDVGRHTFRQPVALGTGPRRAGHPRTGNPPRPANEACQARARSTSISGR